MMMSFLLAALLQAAPPEGVRFERNVVYGKGAGEDLTLNLARPQDAPGPLPCVLVIHGGGWAAGRKELHDTLTWDFAKRGYACATIGYRLAPKHLFPAQVEDVKCAVRYLRAHAADLKIDPKRLGATGFSAGAHLSMMLGAMGPGDGLEGEGGWADQPSQVSCVVAWFGPADFANVEFPDASRPIVERWIGGPRSARAEAYRLASPVTYASKGDAPMLLLQGTKDPLVPHDQAYRMADALTAAGVPGRVDLILGAGHGWGPPELPRTLDAMHAFLDGTLKKP
jgi:acetyl esterase/lipase